jgi:hypothetical protein
LTPSHVRGRPQEDNKREIRFYQPAPFRRAPTTPVPAEARPRPVPPQAPARWADRTARTGPPGGNTRVRQPAHAALRPKALPLKHPHARSFLSFETIHCSRDPNRPSFWSMKGRRVPSPSRAKGPSQGSLNCLGVLARGNFTDRRDASCTAPHPRFLQPQPHEPCSRRERGLLRAPPRRLLLGDTSDAFRTLDGPRAHGFARQPRPARSKRQEMTWEKFRDGFVQYHPTGHRHLRAVPDHRGRARRGRLPDHTPSARAFMERPTRDYKTASRHVVSRCMTLIAVEGSSPPAVGPARRPPHPLHLNPPASAARALCRAISESA